MPTFLIRHNTVYRYRSPVAFGEHRLMLRPRESFDQRTLSHALVIVPEPASLGWSEDPSGNLVGVARFSRRARELRFEAVLRVVQQPLAAGDLRLADHARAAPFSYGAEEAADLARFIERREPDPGHRVDRWARDLLAAVPDRASLGFLRQMTDVICREFAYLRREEAGIQAPAETLRRRQGTCRDFALLMIEAVRSQGFAARFVSGYLHVASPASAAARAGGSTHAWLQVYLPGCGWVDFDPTSGGIGSEGLIRVAAVREPASASPLSGTFLGFPSDFVGLSVDVDVAVAGAVEQSSQPGLAA